MKQINEWAMRNGLMQCMGCKGFDKSEKMTWYHVKCWGNAFPFCTKECKELIE